MGKDQSKKRDFALRKQRSVRKKQLKRKVKQIRLRTGQQRIDFVERPALADMGPPEGFRTIPMSQAIMQYAKPLMEKTRSEEDLQGAMQSAMVFWNYSLARMEGKTSANLADIETGILKSLKASFGMDGTAAREFLEMMAARYAYLFPPEIQPRGTPFMFIRKEERHQIRPIEEDSIRLSPKEVTPTAREDELFKDLRRLDALVGQGAEWDEKETLLFSIKDNLGDAFRDWLSAKGIEEPLADDFANCLPIWLDFVYAYGHDEDTPLGKVPISSWLEFFNDFLLRKLMTDPSAYVNWPPALRFFYRYLQERGYIDRSLEAENAIRRIEPEFYVLLHHEFS
jgi:hypothetical protein